MAYSGAVRHRRAPVHSPRALAALLAVAAAVGLAACGTGVSTSSFKGTEKQVAETISNLQADATANDPGKICSRDFAQPVVRSLGGAKGCEEAVKSQVRSIDSLELTIQSVSVAPGGLTASAVAKSVHSGKTKPYTMSLRKESGGWRITAWKLQG